MIQYLDIIKTLIFPALLETIYMVFFSGLFSIVIGILLGIILYVTHKGGIMENYYLNKILSCIVNLGRSIPFVILIIVVFPLSRFIVGTSIGSTAAIVPLTIASIPFVARLVEGNLQDVDKGIIEASISLGATNLQIITKVLIPESMHNIVHTITITLINIIGYSAMAGLVGGGGLGDVANRYGAQRYRIDVLIITIIAFVILVQFIQILGSFISNKLNKRL